jgi:hypothetical protein
MLTRQSWDLSKRNHNPGEAHPLPFNHKEV